MVETIMKAVGLRPDQCITTGDRLYTEIRMGIASGMDTAVVFTGETTPEMLATTAPGERPTYSLERIDQLLPARFW
jgi:ribonucleotide monophosphatase NagD (HAD superfamily)